MLLSYVAARAEPGKRKERSPAKSRQRKTVRDYFMHCSLLQRRGAPDADDGEDGHEENEEEESAEVHAVIGRPRPSTVALGETLQSFVDFLRGHSLRGQGDALDPVAQVGWSPPSCVYNCWSL